MTSTKTKEFTFNLEEKNLLRPILIRNIGRPKKDSVDKLSKQITLKFKVNEMKKLQDIYLKNHKNEYSFGNFLRLLILKQLKIDN
ncbi:hypothetical protein JS61_08045 (plasmid) [Rickettsia felis]|uniref:hypothetical protein n=1 Tax=Rickettsia felis TaxID=42862 RepID=UPI00057494AB|nr:hypothetical protein [Rickettsia felis]KHO02166.1 hypothetical protein JS61_08045 [Rickettsia felis]